MASRAPPLPHLPAQLERDGHLYAATVENLGEVRWCCRACRQQRRVLLTTRVAGAQGPQGRCPRPNQGRLPRKPRALPCSVWKASKANIQSCPLLGLAQVVARLDPSRLVPYDKGDPAGIVRRIDAAMGLRPKPL